MDGNTIKLFEIGQIDAYYAELGNKCKGQNFAFAIRRDAADKQPQTYCQWRVPENTTEKFPVGDGLIQDIDGNCIFACVTDPKKTATHAERLISKFLEKNGGKKEKLSYYFYTYPHPCRLCFEDDDYEDKEKLFGEYNGFYYTLFDKMNSGYEKPLNIGREIWSPLLGAENSGQQNPYGLSAIRIKSGININTVIRQCKELLDRPKDQRGAAIRRLSSEFDRRAVSSCIRQKEVPQKN